MLQIGLLTPPQESLTIVTALQALGPVVFALGWLLLVALILWIAWEVYMLIIQINYVISISWEFLEIILPEDTEETPKSMEVLYDVMGGIHKDPDIPEKYFDGYITAWYSLELHCTQGRARYIAVVPKESRQFFEGVVYGQYPRAEIREVEDYSQRYNPNDVNETYEIWLSDIILSEDDIYPIKTYREFEASLAPDDKFVDPHQSLVEAYTNINPGEEFWYQLLVRPMSAKYMKKVAEEGAETVKIISGQADEPPDSFAKQLWGFFRDLPGNVYKAFLEGPLETDDKDEIKLRFFNPVDEAKMKGITQKTMQSLYKAKIRVAYIAPKGKMSKPNIARAIGVFKQFNTWHLNGLKPDGDTKTNGPNYVLRNIRREFRQKKMLINYQSRDLFGLDAGQWYTAEELATLYHFPVNLVKAPALERSQVGAQQPPTNLPYAE